MNNLIDLSNSSRKEFLARVASLYYDQEKTQQEIANMVGVSRSAVSRFLTEAKEKGIVKISIRYPYRTIPSLEKELKEKFRLQEVRVLMRGDKTNKEMVEGLGFLAAEYFTKIVEPDSNIGVSWGTNLYQTIKAFTPMSLPDTEVVQLVGGTGLEAGSAIGPLLAPMLAEKLSCPCYYLNAPLILSSPEMRDLIVNEPMIKESMNHFEKVDIALVGIGSLHLDIYNPYRLGYITAEEIREMVSCGAVGDVCVTHFTRDGSIVCEEINNRVIGIHYKDLQKIPTIIGVAGGNLKAQAILGALRAKLLTVLITDEVAAKLILEELENASTTVTAYSAN